MLSSERDVVPDWEEIGVFFVVNKDALNRGGIRFQVKNERFEGSQGDVFFVR